MITYGNIRLEEARGGGGGAVLNVKRHPSTNVMSAIGWQKKAYQGLGLQALDWRHSASLVSELLGCFSCQVSDLHVTVKSNVSSASLNKYTLFGQ